MDQEERLRSVLADRYRIEREIGSGGMATVFLAEDLRHHRKVAVKVLNPELAQNLGAERFLREIETAANLTHPHILPLHDSGEADGFLYYVMPYVEGESLRSRLTRETQLPVEDAVQITREIADALAYAHERGVIHRDVKPANILLESGHAVLADFGVAHAIAEAKEERLTRTGTSLGTPAYMSPEQATGERDLDERSDQYALGCVLYEMLAGYPPFTGATAESVIRQHLTVEPAGITCIRPSVTAQVAAALGRALSKTPADRFDRVALFAEAIVPRASTMTSEPSVAATPVQGPVWWKRMASAGLAGVIVIAVAVAVGRWMRSGADGPGSTSGHQLTAIAVLPFQNLSAEGPYTYFAGGLHDELLTELSKVATLSVRGRTSVMGYGGTTKPIREIADELAVGTILEGSVQVLGDRLRVNVQLIDAASDEHIWADRYDRTLDDAFAVQSEIAQKVVAAVGAELTEAETSAISSAPTEDAEAYRLYLQGEEYRKRPTAARQDLEIAQQFFEKALALDSTFALAYASLSLVHQLLYWLGYDPFPGRLERQRAAAEKAIRLAPDLPQARLAMGRVHYAERDYARALEELTFAVEGMPGSAELWSNVGFTQRRLGNWDQALAAFEKATILDPRDATLFFDLGGLSLLFLHRYGDAIEAEDRALDLAPALAEAQLWKASAHLLWRGELDSLRSVLQRGPEEYGSDGSRKLWQARVALLERRPDTLLTLLGAPETVMFESQSSYEPGLLYAAWAHQLRGDGNAATRAFTGALAQLDLALVELPGDWRLRASRGLALAGLGRGAEARAEAEWLRTTVPRGFDRADKVQYEAVAMIFAQVGAIEEALREIEQLLEGPSMTSVHTLRLDPRFDAIRNNPRFQALLEKYRDDVGR